jgi:hypothetical protein
MNGIRQEIIPFVQQNLSFSLFFQHSQRILRNTSSDLHVSVHLSASSFNHRVQFPQTTIVAAVVKLGMKIMPLEHSWFWLVSAIVVRVTKTIDMRNCEVGQTEV